MTRGKTARNRLRRVDLFVVGYDPQLLRRQDGPFRGARWVDLGYGGEPFTALETSARWREVAPGLKGIGVEIDPDRVRRARPYADDYMDFRLGGFNLPLEKGETVRLVRAFNVLRQYPPEAVPEALADLSMDMPEGALLVEGTSDPPGRVWVANVLRRTSLGPSERPWAREALVLSTNFRNGLDPLLFQAVLPKDQIHEMVPGTPIFEFFERWKEAMRDTKAWSDWGLRQWFAVSARRLRESGYAIDLRRRWLRRGYLIWRLPDL